MKRVDAIISAENASWSFDGIATEFDEHVARSVPLYQEGHKLILQLLDFFLTPGAVITDLGSATGALAGKIFADKNDKTDFTYIGIDSSEDMVVEAKQRFSSNNRVEFFCDNLATCDLPQSSVIISYYTMQFIAPKYRQQVFNKIYDALEWGGILILFEKVRAPDARFQDIATQLYQEFKIANDFSHEEIINKSRSLKSKLEPFSTQGNIDLMKRAGFIDIMTIAKWVCFEGFIAIK